MINAEKTQKIRAFLFQRQSGPVILFQVILEMSKRAKRKDEERREGAAPFKLRSKDL